METETLRDNRGGVSEMHAVVVVVAVAGAAYVSNWIEIKFQVLLAPRGKHQVPPCVVLCCVLVPYLPSLYLFVWLACLAVCLLSFLVHRVSVAMYLPVCTYLGTYLNVGTDVRRSTSYGATSHCIGK